MKRTPTSLRPNHNYPKTAIASNLPQNIKIIETFDDNDQSIIFSFRGYSNSTFSFDYVLIFMNQLVKNLQLFLGPVWFYFPFACLTISHDYSTLLIKRLCICISAN